MGERINIQNLIDLFAEKKGLSKKDAETFLKEMFALIEQALETDKYVKIKGLGTFKLIDVDSRESVNVNTGERIEIKGHTKISFTPEASIRDQINKPFSHFETIILNEGVTFDDINTSLGDESVDNENESGSSVEEDVIQEKTNLAIEEITDLVKPSENITEDSEIKEEEEHFSAEDIAKVPEQALPVSDSIATKVEYANINKEEEEKTSDESSNKVAETTIPSVEPVELIANNTEKEEPVSNADSNIAAESSHLSAVSVEVKAPAYEASLSEINPKPLTTEQDKEVLAKEPLIEELILAAKTEKPDQNYSGRNYSVFYFISMVVFLVVFVGAVFTFIYNPDYIFNLLPDSSGENKIDSVMVDSNQEEEVDSFALTHQVPLATQKKLEQEYAAKVDSIEAATSKTTTKIEKKPEPVNVENIAPVKKDPNNYTITGTKTEYTVKKGESLVRISQHYYNSKDLWTLIVKHNSKVITNPDNVPAGTVIKIPNLRSKL